MLDEQTADAEKPAAPFKIVPTPGRIVWYRRRPEDAFVGRYDDPLAAIVCAVIDDNTVNLAVFCANGQTYPTQRVSLVHSGEPEPGQACWMPYQRQQAMKAAQGD